MKTIQNIIELAKSKNNLSSNRALARELGLSSIHQYKTKGVVPDDVVAIKLARLCSMNPEAVIAICHNAKAKTQEERNIWQHFYKMASAACLALVLSAAILMPSTSEAVTSKSCFKSATMYPLCDVIMMMLFLMALRFMSYYETDYSYRMAA